VVHGILDHAGSLSDKYNALLQVAVATHRELGPLTDSVEANHNLDVAPRNIREEGSLDNESKMLVRVGMRFGMIVLWGLLISLRRSWK
jgi:hypothetical protein